MSKIKLAIHKMNSPKSLIAHPKNAQEFRVLKAFMETLKINFEVSKDVSYNPVFVEKIIQSERDITEGNGIKLSVDEFKALCK